MQTVDLIDHPAHYNTHPSGVECISIVRYLPFSLANAFKYLWRCSLKGAHDQDLDKAIWYLKDFKAHPIYPSIDSDIQISIVDAILAEKSEIISKSFSRIQSISIDRQYLCLVDPTISDIETLKQN